MSAAFPYADQLPGADSVVGLCNRLTFRLDCDRWEPRALLPGESHEGLCTYYAPDEHGAMIFWVCGGGVQCMSCDSEAGRGCRQEIQQAVRRLWEGDA